MALLCLLATGAARAADSIYWVNNEAHNISHANLAGDGGQDIPVDTGNFPFGLAIDSAAGKVYWSNPLLNTISFANLDGSGVRPLDTTGAPVAGPQGLAIDPVAGRIYWANGAAGMSTVGFASLSGGGGGELDTTGIAMLEPSGVVFDPRANRIYVTDSVANRIFFADVNGGGGHQLDTTGAPVSEPVGAAIDAAANRIYWSNFGNGTIGSANLSGGGGAELDTTGAETSRPIGVAIDPARRKIYWSNQGNSSIGSAGLGGGGGVRLRIKGATTEKMAFPALLETPLGARPPVASVLPSPNDEAPRPGATLSCSQGTWAPDLLESFLYRAPQTFSFQWLRNGAAIAGASSSSLKTSLVGAYTCQVTATNFSGSTSQTSAPILIAATIKIGKARLNLRTGTGILPVTLTGSGRLSLTGRGLVTQRRANVSGAVKLLLKARGKAKRTLFADGKVKLRAIVAFTPAGGRALRRTATIRLRLR